MSNKLVQQIIELKKRVKKCSENYTKSVVWCLNIKDIKNWGYFFLMCSNHLDFFSPDRPCISITQAMLGLQTIGSLGEYKNIKNMKDSWLL